mmetsp:Transcript_62599/g.104196  ORF Transcript_62599/g.104196 Transcript_62599/m.104196 type:complete len:421 (-) Transcript_62599:504-1766(-)
MLLVLSAAVYACLTPPCIPNTCICCTGRDECCHAPFRDFNCNFQKTNTKCSQDHHCTKLLKPPHGTNKGSDAYNGCKCQLTDSWLGAKEHALSNCTLAASKPTPMVILSLGRSGSLVTAMRLANLTGSGYGNPLGSERVTGSTLNPSPGLDPNRRPTNTPVHDIHAYFCAKQRERTAGDVEATRLVGFKWKPLVLEGVWDDAFKWLGTHREVRVVHLRRNALDKFISGVKHGSSKCINGTYENPGPWREEYVPGISAGWQPKPPSGESSRRLAVARSQRRHSDRTTTQPRRRGRAHCTTNNNICSSLTKQVNLSVDCILPFLDANRADAEQLVGKLEKYGANYKNFSYFELYKAPEPQVIEAWRRLLRFLGVAAWEVSLDDVVGASDLLETTPYAQAETVLNYEEVVARLKPSAYAHLLH